MATSNVSSQAAEDKLRREFAQKVAGKIKEYKKLLATHKVYLSSPKEALNDLCDQATRLEQMERDQIAIDCLEGAIVKLEKLYLILKDKTKPLACPYCGQPITLERLMAADSFDCIKCAEKKETRIRH